MTRVMTELILIECMEKDRAESSLAKPKVDDDVKIELSKEHIMELRNNAYRGTEEEDIVDHIAKVLEIVDLIKTPNMDTDRLRVHVFPFSLTGDAREWWIDEGNDKIIAWSEVVGRFFYKYYPLSRVGKYNVTRDEDDEGPDFFEFEAWLNSKFNNHRRMDGTKSALWHYWVKGEGNNELMDDIESSDKEWEESDYGNPPNTDTNSFFKPYLDAQEKNDIGRGDEHDQMNHGDNVSKVNDIILKNTPNSDNIKDEQLNKGCAGLKSLKLLSIH
ncbi:hypothetical protein Tco_0728537 [Tanacetum coccineum]|uniref:Retrotransposon gag domain-containing protein n=1 Tax=Tanacetum coccineum TaxID=301880 RepID=A0ABQ4YMI9_9ASTR